MAQRELRRLDETRQALTLTTKHVSRLDAAARTKLAEAARALPPARCRLRAAARALPPARERAPHQLAALIGLGVDLVGVCRPGTTLRCLDPVAAQRGSSQLVTQARRLREALRTTARQ